jgi:hypothetical protein
MAFSSVAPEFPTTTPLVQMRVFICQCKSRKHQGIKFCLKNIKSFNQCPHARKDFFHIDIRGVRPTRTRTLSVLRIKGIPGFSDRLRQPSGGAGQLDAVAKGGTAAVLVDSVTCPTVWLPRDSEYLAFL